MDDKVFLAEIDAALEEYQDAWAKELQTIASHKRFVPNSERANKKIEKLNKKYSKLMADLILEREDVYNRLAAADQAEFLAQFEPKPGDSEDNTQDEEETE